jgi:ribose transport system ATP-binding protein
MTALLEARGIEKRYGPVVALRDASLTVAPGEIHALLGANGAGKSTLVKALTGVIRADRGTIAVGGEQPKITSPARAVQVGLAPVFQDPALLPDLTVQQNLRLTRASADAVRERLRAMELDIDFADRAGDVPLPLQRMLDLARALSRNPRVLLLDEITAALPSDLSERVYSIIRDWRDQGHSVLLITHRLAEVIALCDRATVLRDGTDVGTLVPQEGGEERIVEYMLGPEAAKAEGAAVRLDESAAAPPPAHDDGAVVVEVRDLAIDQLHDVCFTLRAGEILGIAALEGQGQDDLFAALSGQRSPDGGEIVVKGARLRARHPYDAIRAGLVLVPADRLQALLPQRSVAENVAAPRYNRVGRWGPINMRAERRRVRTAIDELQIDIRAQRQVRRLSGGNQQKVTIARWLASGFSALLCFDPTRGIDVGTKRQVYGLLRRLADNGAAILFFSSELAEFPLICDRVVTLFGGRVTGELTGAAADEASLLYAMHGLATGEAPDRPASQPTEEQPA